ncbi:MAG: ATP-binding protein [Pseudomonadota bacterium]
MIKISPESLLNYPTRSAEETERIFDEVTREAQALDSDFVSRLCSVTLGAILNAFFLEWYIVASCFALLIATELLLKLEFQWLKNHRTWRLYWSINLTTFLGGLAFALPAAFMWFDGAIAAKLIALANLFGGLVHVAIVRASHLPMSVATILPMVLTMLALPIEPVVRGEDTILIVSSTITVLVTLGYLTSAFVANNKTKKTLVEALEGARMADAAKTQFLASMSHEIRTPLNGIVGITQSIGDVKTGEDISEKVRVLSQSARSLVLIVDDVLDLSKIEAGKFEINPARAQIFDEISDVIDLYIPQTLEKGLKLDLFPIGELPQAGDFDTLRVRQCLGNLLSNAIKFTSLGSVTVKVECKERSENDALIEVSVQDTGCGIEQELQGELFKRFGRLNEAQHKGIKGTGLGLAITKELANLMGGTVAVSSRKGSGSTFTFSFRVNDPSTRIKSTTLPPRYHQDLLGDNASGKRLLLVDDTATNRYVAKLLLEPSGFVVSEAESGEEALEMLAKESFDLILLDIRMPEGIDGMETFRRLRASRMPNADTPVVALTADALENQKREFLAIGMDGYIAKPIDKRLMFEEIQRVLETTQSSRTI